MTCGSLIASACLIVLLSPGLVRPQEGEVPASPSRPAAGRVSAASKQAAEDRAILRQLSEAQRWLGEQTWHIKERVEALHSEFATLKDRDSTVEQELKALRDEVKGLYVESSTVKQQIDALKEDISGVNSNVSGFRTFSGFFIAVMILLLAVIFVLTIRR